MNQTSGSAADRRATTYHLLLLIGVFTLALALNASRAVRAGYNHDEDQFIASARLLLDQGLLPYQDYPYFHTPYLVFIYALLFALTGNYNLLAARLFSAVCASLTTLLVVLIVLHFFRRHPVKYRWLAALGILFLFIPNPIVAATASFSWNHSLSVLLMLSSLWLVLLAAEKASPGRWLFAAGALLGLAIGVRVSSITLLPAILLALAWFPAEFSWRHYARLALLFGAGLGLTLLPLVWSFGAAPRQFIFGNLEYARLNAAYRLDVPVAYDINTPVYGAMTMSEKFVFLWNQVIEEPANLLFFASLVFFGWSVLGLQLGKKDAHTLRNVLILAAAPLVAVGSFLPTPSWYQYFYAPVPFAMLAIALGLAYLTQEPGQMRRWFNLLFIQLVLIANLYLLPDYRRMSFLRYIDLWKPLVIHEVGQDIREQLGPGKQVLTLAPLYALEGGMQVYPSLATGVFAYRTGPLLSAEQQRANGILSAQNLEASLEGNLPDGILAGFNEPLESEIVAFAASHSYQPYPLTKTLTLWVRP